MPKEIIWVERYQVSSLCVAGVVCYQGRQPYMEDRFCIIPNINGSEVSLYSVFDGHAGSFAADYARQVIMPSIGEKLGEILEIVKVKTAELARLAKLAADKKKGKKQPEPEPLVEEVENAEKKVTNPLEAYITPENIVNYEQLIHDEILSFDSILTERMSKSLQFGGTTANIILVDLSNKIIVCANVGDSRAVMCDSKGLAFPLSRDHKPNDAEEMTRIRENGGFVSNKNGCWRVDGSLACSRSLGDYPLKQKKVIIADPDITTFKFKDFKNLPKFIILGTDGLFDVFKNQEMCDFTKKNLKEQHYGARSLMKKAYARKSADNITTIVIRFIKPKVKKPAKPSFDLTSNTYEWLK